MFFSIGADNGDGVTNLEDLGVAKDGAVPTISLVCREGDQTGDAVLAFDVFVGDHFNDAGHLFSFGGIN
ncbi:hypothetical protein SDC9_99674 [bioreactor metagenome]|uniref:Uncharacterized protein n=1 Tax=bioreactor metagenome TaxID=1076179 RepID=A0A645AI96_9ZZZZ